jgi:hypothetical protein
VTASDTVQLAAERAPFVMLPRWLLHHRDISDGAKVLYGVLHDLVAGREGPTRPVTRAQLADCCGVSVATVDRRLAELVASRAVDKHAQFETHLGQLANVYWVRLSPPAADLRPPVDNPGPPGRGSAAPPAADLQPPLPHQCEEGSLTAAAPFEEGKQELDLPPQPPRRAGGPKVDHDPTQPPGPRATGTSLRAAGANPRAEADRTEATRQAELAAQRAADLEAEQATRRAAEEAARADVDRLAAEALALSAILDDALLEAIAVRVGEGLAGPLSRSPLAVTRAVVAWCRSAVATHPGPAPLVFRTALAADRGPVEGSSRPLDLPEPPPGTPELRARIAGLLQRDPPSAAPNG